MAKKIKMKVIAPKEFNIRAVDFEPAIEKTLDSAAKKFDKTINTWKHKPEFKTEIISEGDNYISGMYYTESDIYKFVSRGTRVRYATLTPDFKPKTKVGVIGSGPGKGGVLYIDTTKPRPGIKAREFEEEVAKRQSGFFRKRVDEQTKRIAKKSRHKI